MISGNTQREGYLPLIEIDSPDFHNHFLDFCYEFGWEELYFSPLVCVAGEWFGDEKNPNWSYHVFTRLSLTGDMDVLFKTDNISRRSQKVHFKKGLFRYLSLRSISVEFSKDNEMYLTFYIPYNTDQEERRSNWEMITIFYRSVLSVLPVILQEYVNRWRMGISPYWVSEKEGCIVESIFKINNIE